MDAVVSVLLVLTAGLAGLWKAIPVGIALNLNGTLLAPAAATGSLVSVMVLFLSGAKLKGYLLSKRTSRGMDKRKDRARRLFDTYGIAGLSFFGTALIGPQLTLLLGLGITQAHKKLLFSISICTIFWSALITVTFITGYESLRSII
jgi:hypothetical protein